MSGGPEDLARGRRTTDPYERLAALERKRRELATLVIHDLRNPLAAMNGFLELLRRELHGQGTALSLVDDLDALADKALAMLGTLLDVEELEEGVLIAAPAPVRIDEFVAELIPPYRAAASARNLALETTIPPLEARLDPSLIGRVLENLLDNAVRYANRRGRVDVSIAREGADLVVRIGNDGPAVPEADRARIFERYFRIEARRAAARENRGLGLYFCRLAAVAHGGSIAIASTTSLPCVFELRLPQPADAATSPARPE